MLTRILGFSFRLRTQPTRSPLFSSSRNNLQHTLLRSTTTMPRLIGRALQDDMAHTIIEDSEPEREAEEAMLREQRRIRKAEAKRQKKAAKTRQSSEVIIISDSERIVHDIPSTKPIKPSFIEISDTTASSAAAPLPAARPTNREPIPPLSSYEEAGDFPPPSSLTENTNHSQGPPSNENNHPIDLAASITSSAYPDSPPAKLDLSRFAFGGRAGSSTKSKPTQNEPEAAPVQAIPKAPKKAVLDLPLADIFTTPQLTVLSKCVVCNLAWTTRKTVPVKLLHMKQCAKKHEWKEESVILAMTEVIAREPAPIAKERKNKGKGKPAPPVEEAPNTYLEDLINEAAPKKRRKKDAVVVTVVNPQEAHAEILERAKALFPLASSSGLPQNDPGLIPSTQAFGPSKVGGSGARVSVLGTGMLEDQTAPSGEQSETENNAVPPSTQAFRPSALGNAFVKRSILQNDNDNIAIEDASEMSPPTQAFGRSGLAARFGKSKRSMLDSDDSDSEDLAENRPVSPRLHNPARPSNPIPSSSTPPHLDIRAPLTLHSVNEELLYLPATAHVRLAELDRRLAGVHTSSTSRQKPREVEDPYPIPPSVYEKLAEARTQFQQEKADKARNELNSKGKHKALSSSSSRSSRSRSKSRSRSRKSRKQRRKSRSPFKYQRQMEVLVNKNQYNTLDEEMRQIIMEDKQLYMRILRFEPIHFDIFFKAATQRGMSGRGLRLSLREFLDRQAINFYGDSALAKGRARH